MTKCSLRRIQYRAVVYNEIGHNPRDPANKKGVSMEEKRLAKRDKFLASYEKLELMGPVEHYLVNPAGKLFQLRGAM